MDCLRCRAEERAESAARRKSATQRPELARFVALLHQRRNEVQQHGPEVHLQLRDVFVALGGLMLSMTGEMATDDVAILIVAHHCDCAADVARQVRGVGAAGGRRASRAARALRLAARHHAAARG